MGLELVMDNNEVFTGKESIGVLARRRIISTGGCLFENWKFFTITYYQSPRTLFRYKDVPFTFSIADSPRHSDGEILPFQVPRFIPASSIN